MSNIFFKRWGDMLMAKYCSNCEKGVSEDVTYCTNCGSAVNGTQNQQTAYQTQRPAKQKKK